MITNGAKLLRDAQQHRQPCEPLTSTYKLDMGSAYAIQQANIDARLKEGLDGQPGRIIGRKVGLTSEAIQSWLKVDQPDFGTLLSDMWIPDGGVASMRHLLQPRAEAEIAFVMNRRLAGPGLRLTDVMSAVEFVLPAIEIIDSRIKDWKITFEDTIADNASSGLFVLGSTPHLLPSLDLRLCGMSLWKNGTLVSTGAGVACLGHPLNAVLWLANTLGAMGSAIEVGDIVLSGALGPVTPVVAGDALTAHVNGLGSCSVCFGG